MILSAASVRASSQDPLAGDWTGALDVGGTQLRLVFHIGPEEDGNRTGTMDSPDQGTTGLPIATVALADSTVRMTMPAMSGSYEGRLSADGKTIDGTWTQGGSSLPLKLEKSAASVEPPSRPQEPKPPFPYASQDITYPNDASTGVTLAGTLTMPEAGGPFPAVVLVSGSGPQNRNEELLGHKPFLVLSDALTRRGIAVLRYDDRGVASSTGAFATATSEDFAGDALAGVRYLKTRPEIDPGRIGIIGHSEGGLIAPIAAARSDDVAFIVLMAGPGVTGEEILYLQG
ncbi:MAG: alpha/beta hydrolase family protein, partial [Planctomycetaceae bacterium]